MNSQRGNVARSEITWQAKSLELFPPLNQRTRLMLLLGSSDKISMCNSLKGTRSWHF